MLHRVCDTNKTIIKCYRSFFYRGLRISPSLWQYVILFYHLRLNAWGSVVCVILSYFLVWLFPYIILRCCSLYTTYTIVYCVGCCIIIKCTRPSFWVIWGSTRWWIQPILPGNSKPTHIIYEKKPIYVKLFLKKTQKKLKNGVY